MTDWLPLIAGLLTAVVGGVYLAFSVLVIPALRRRPPAEAGTTMVSVNEQAVRPPFMILFIAAALASIAVLVVAVPLVRPGTPPLHVIGALLSMLGWVSTVAVNVPLNTRLAAASDRAEGWVEFDKPWTRANNLRAVLSLAGAVALLAPWPA